MDVMDVTPFRRLVAVTACMATLALLGFSIASGAQDNASAHPTLAFATVSRRNVTETVTLDGVIDRGERTFYAGGQAVPSSTTGTGSSSGGGSSSSGGSSSGSGSSAAAGSTNGSGSTGSAPSGATTTGARSRQVCLVGRAR